MAKSPARRGSPLPPMTWVERWQRYSGRKRKIRKGHWQRPDVFALHGGGWDYDNHRTGRSATKRRAIEDQRG